MTTKKADGPLARWSQRKLLVQEGKISPEFDVEPTDDSDTDIQSAVQSDPSDNLDEKGEDQQDPITPQDENAQTETENTEFENFDFDSLNADSDYTKFMAENVPEMVKRRALRVLWNSDPIFANLDGLNDYDEDFTDAAVITKGIESAWSVGKGYMTDEDEEQEPDEEIEIAEADAQNIDEDTAAEKADGEDTVSEDEEPTQTAEVNVENQSSEEHDDDDDDENENEIS